MKISNRLRIISVISICMFAAAAAFAVNSRIVTHSSADVFLKGKTENIIIDSQGTLKLAPKTETLEADFTDCWTINTLAADKAGNLYIGTSPNGYIFKYDGDNLVRIYPAVEEEPATEQADADVAETGDDAADEPADKAEATAEDKEATAEKFTNQHIYAMTFDIKGRLLAAVSGDNCRLMRMEGDSFQAIYTADDDYIFAMAVDKTGSIFLATGAEGNIYQLDAEGKNPQMIYDAKDKNILSLAIDSAGILYAGSDERGVVYKINPADKAASVLYDCDQTDVTALVFDAEGNLYAAATTAQAAAAQQQNPAPQAVERPGKPEGTGKAGSSASQLNIAGTRAAAEDKSRTQPPAVLTKGAAPKGASHIYKITPAGYVSIIHAENGLFLSMAEKGNDLLLGTGNEGRLFTINTERESKAFTYKDEKASQITALSIIGSDIFAATSNPASIIKLSESFNESGTYTSELIDAGQPTDWGKIQLDAMMPENSSVWMQTRTGNINDAEDATFGAWSKETKIEGAVEITSPAARFCQYRLILKSQGEKTPEISKVAISNVVGNLAPKVITVTAGLHPKKPGTAVISFKAKDENGDRLVYQIDYRKAGSSAWIRMAEDHPQEGIEFNTQTVEDARYEFRVIADDKFSNSPDTAMTGSWISDALVIDNTAPKILNDAITVNGKKVNISLVLDDNLSAIGGLEYSIDSREKWHNVLPADNVFDTTQEKFSFAIEDIETGSHVISLRFKDDIGNTQYKSYEIVIR